MERSRNGLNARISMLGWPVRRARTLSRSTMLMSSRSKPDAHAALGGSDHAVAEQAAGDVRVPNVVLEVERLLGQIHHREAAREGHARSGCG